MEGVFGVIGLGLGLYCLYGCYMLRFKHEINRTILLPKNVNIKKCKDLDGYCKEALPPRLILGIAATLYGASDLYNTYIGEAKTVFYVFMTITIVALVIYAVMIKKINNKYFKA